MKENANIEDINKLINAFTEYRNELYDYGNILVNAATVCEVAMGSDDVIRKYIDRLKVCLASLEKTMKVAENIAEVITNDRDNLIKIYEEIE